MRVPFQEESDNIKNFPNMKVFHAFKKQRYIYWYIYIYIYVVMHGKIKRAAMYISEQNMRCAGFINFLMSVYQLQ